VSPEELLRWAEKVEESAIIDEVNQMIDALRHAPPPVFVPLTQQVPLVHDCGCPKYGICMSTACPRAIKITNGLNA
jgi:hypothetical protein